MDDLGVPPFMEKTIWWYMDTNNVTVKDNLVDWFWNRNLYEYLIYWG